jgi:uncharacterized protein YkwD
VNSRRFALIALLAGFSAGCSQVDPVGEKADPADRVMILGDFDHALLARAIFDESNRVRAVRGAPPLAHDPALDAAADEQAAHMALVLRAEHENPVPGELDVTERVARSGQSGALVAENVLMMPARRPAGAADRDFTYASYAASLVDAWMNSPGHRANLLNPDFGFLGCAAELAHGVRPGDQRVFAVQVFLAPFPEKPEPQDLRPPH